MGRDQKLEEGEIEGKVLPLDLPVKEVSTLYSYLPDDLRPESLADAKNILWLECKNEQSGKYDDGTKGYRQTCKAFLVERISNKFIAIQDFIGVPPAFTKKKANEDAIGEILPERYITFLKEKQTELQRSDLHISTDSPNHHLLNKNETIYSTGLLIILGAIGFGWAVFKVRYLIFAK